LVTLSFSGLFDSGSFGPSLLKNPLDRDRLRSFFFFFSAAAAASRGDRLLLLLLLSRLLENHERGFFFPVAGSTYATNQSKTVEALTSDI